MKKRKSPRHLETGVEEGNEEPSEIEEDDSDEGDGQNSYDEEISDEEDDTLHGRLTVGGNHDVVNGLDDAGIEIPTADELEELSERDMIFYGEFQN